MIDAAPCLARLFWRVKKWLRPRKMLSRVVYVFLGVLQLVM